MENKQMFKRKVRDKNGTHRYKQIFKPDTPA